MFGDSVSADGTRFAVATADKLARVFESGDRSVTRTLEGHHSAVTAVAFSRDGARVVTGSQDNTVRVWNAATGAPLSAPMHHPGPVWYGVGVAFSPDGRAVVTGCDGRTARV